MKILVTSIVDTERTAYGRLHRFLAHLASNHDVVVISINDWWKANKGSVSKEDTDKSRDHGNIKVVHLTEKKTSPVFQELSSFTTLPKILKEIGYKDFDVHLNHGSMISGYFVTKKVASTGINTIYDVADDLPEMVRNSPQIPALLRPLGGFFGKLFFERNVALSKTVTVAGRFLKEDIKAKDIRIVPNGVDTEIFKYSPRNDLISDLSLSDSFVLGYIGALREWVDLEPVFKAVSKLKKELNIRLLIVGGEEGFEENKKLADKYGVSKETRFIGAVPYSEVPGYISCMDTCLIPFRKNKVADNSCPLKLFEYMACERPVICTRIREVESIVGDRILYASDSTGYVEAVTKLCNDNILKEDMGKKGREFVKENYEWLKLSKDFEEILIEAAKGGSR